MIAGNYTSSEEEKQTFIRAISCIEKLVVEATSARTFHAVTSRLDTQSSEEVAVKNRFVGLS